MVLVKVSFFKTMFSLLLFKCISKTPLNRFYNSQPTIHVACIFAEYQLGAVEDHCLEAAT